jgi:ankyrin repeat protein
MPKGSSSSSSSPGQQLIDACEKGEIAAVRKLLDEGVDVNWKDTLGDTALIYASANGHVEIIKLLLDRGAFIDFIRNGVGGTALMNACFNGQVDCVRLLLEKGADMSIKTNNGKTAKDYAIENGHAGIVPLLDEVCMFQTLDKKVSNIVTLDFTFYYSLSMKQRRIAHHRRRY